MPKTKKKTTPADAVANAKADHQEQEKALRAVVDRLDALAAEERDIIASGDDLDRLDAIVDEREQLERERTTAEKRLAARKNVVQARERDANAARMAECLAEAGRIGEKHAAAVGAIRSALATVDDVVARLEPLELAHRTACRTAIMCAERADEPKPATPNLQALGREGRTVRDLSEFLRDNREAWEGAHV